MIFNIVLGGEGKKQCSLKRSAFPNFRFKTQMFYSITKHYIKVALTWQHPVFYSSYSSLTTVTWLKKWTPVLFTAKIQSPETAGLLHFWKKNVDEYQKQTCKKKIREIVFDHISEPLQFLEARCVLKPIPVDSKCGGTHSVVFDILHEKLRWKTSLKSVSTTG